ncbi:MAG: ABC transporter permease [Wenzhouxiangellaceae bacterium]|nr:ABC transporter permease [Wenzhouxiangellaceae bacterium]MBS3745506.1 ABC transporter permease [Wenzhouxiangellaceae bacterium]MBS3823123.1 ABC transporter permease [Wenzhouxiangellaceae bacterium]
MSGEASQPWVIGAVRRLGNAGMFLLQALSGMKCSFFHAGETMRQIYYIGVRSLIIIMMSGFFVGLVMTLQTYDTLNRFGAGDSVSTVLGLSLFKELGPVLTSILFAGRAGTAVAAEIGLMRATEQIDALDLMGIDPLERIVQPRLLAGMIAVPVLTLIFNFMALLGGVVFGIGIMAIDPITFWGNMQNSIGLWEDFGTGMLKAVAFGVIASWLAVYFGWTAKPTSEGVASATTSTVIATAISVLLLDFVLSALML